MSGTKRIGGRPRSVSPDTTPELVKLAEFLWRALDESGLSVTELQARFTKEHFLGTHPIPSVATVYRRLRGEDLISAGRLVDAIVDICVPPDKATAAKEQADLLKSLARANRAAASSTSSTDDCRTHLAQLAEAQQRVITMQEELFRLKEGRRDAETHDAHSQTVLQGRLQQAETERERLADELTAARREIQALKKRFAVTTVPPRPGDGLELDLVEQELRHLDSDGLRFAKAIRRAFDIAYDGKHTGRFSPRQLSKTEKSHLATIVESALHRDFDLNLGQQLNFHIGGTDVCFRFSQSSTWIIPPEAMSRICLLISADDVRSSFSVGLLRISGDSLTPGRNRDGKRTLSVTGRYSIRFLYNNASFPENILLHTAEDDVTAIIAHHSGMERITELFRRLQKRKVNVATLCTVAMQEDAVRRVRDARRVLRAEGVLVLGATDTRVCTALQLPQLGGGEYVSVRLVRQRPHHVDAPALELHGENWVIATAEDPVELVPAI